MPSLIFRPKDHRSKVPDTSLWPEKYGMLSRTHPTLKVWMHHWPVQMSSNAFYNHRDQMNSYHTFFFSHALQQSKGWMHNHLLSKFWIFFVTFSVFLIFGMSPGKELQNIVLPFSVPSFASFLRNDASKKNLRFPGLKAVSFFQLKASFVCHLTKDLSVKAIACKTELFLHTLFLTNDP